MSLSHTLTQPIIRLTLLRQAFVSAAFTALAIVTPVIAHQFNLAGPTYLPMHIFVFVAALLFGWRVGLAVGLMSPLLSHLITGLPLANILPIVTVELAVYGLTAGWLKEKKKLPVWLALVSAMIAGRVILLPVVAAFSQMPALNYVSQAIRTGWPGILVQLALVPLLVQLLSVYLKRNSE